MALRSIQGWVGTACQQADVPVGEINPMVEPLGDRRLIHLPM
ncbi:MAG TPA: hypothetical protein PKV13_01310 [Propionicimonas sp.]|nr:hypothetical protein [Propionicimonas sp.]